MSELNKLTISEAYQGLRDKKFSSEDLVSACLTAIGDKDGDINSYVYVDEDGAYEVDVGCTEDQVAETNTEIFDDELDEDKDDEIEVVYQDDVDRNMSQKVEKQNYSAKTPPVKTRRYTRNGTCYLTRVLNMIFLKSIQSSSAPSTLDAMLR